MLFCRNCGTQLPEGSKFCPNCGERMTPVYEEKRVREGTVTFSRMSSAVAKVVKTKVVVDGIAYGALKENEQLTIIDFCINYCNRHGAPAGIRMHLFSPCGRRGKEIKEFTSVRTGSCKPRRGFRF